MKHTLEVFSGDKLVFYSDGKWLYPCFELEHFLATTEYEPATLTVHDKIVGRAAALLLIHLGIRDVVAGIMSGPGREALEYHQVKYRYESLVDQITCSTEGILMSEHDPRQAYAILKERARL